MYFVFDLETVPDLEMVRASVPNPPQEEQALLERAGEEFGRGTSKFLPPMFHRMVCWVGLWIDAGGNPVQQEQWVGEDEKGGLLALFDTLRTYKDFGLIHHNGRGFDLPVITYRSMRHGLQMPLRLSSHDIRYRFSNHNVDLMDEFSNYGASSFPKLKQLGVLVNIPFKQTSEGDKVSELFGAGELEKIQTYCHEDVMATYLLWIHLKFTNGELTPENFANLKERALKKLSALQNVV